MNEIFVGRKLPAIRYASLVHVEQLEMAQQFNSLKDTVQFKLYRTEQNNEKLYSNTTQNSHQTTTKAVTSPETEDPMFSDVCIWFDDNRTMTTNIISKISEG